MQLNLNHRLRTLIAAVTVVAAVAVGANAARADVVTGGDLRGFSLNGGFTYTYSTLTAPTNPDDWMYAPTGVAVGYNKTAPTSGGSLLINAVGDYTYVWEYQMEIGGSGAVVRYDGSGGPPAEGPNYAGTGTVTVTGAGAQLSILNDSGLDGTWLTVGRFANGSLHIADNALVTVGTTVDVGYSQGVSGTINVGAGATFLTGADQYSEMYINGVTGMSVGYGGAGLMTIHDGGTTTSYINDGVRVGVKAGSSGTISVDGAGSEWNVFRGGGGTYGIYVASAGSGRVEITNGAHANTDTRVLVGSSANASGTVVVDGQGSLWNINTAMSISNPSMIGSGSAGTGTMTITNGGEVYNANSMWVGGATGCGIVTVNGPASKWTCGAPISAQSYKMPLLIGYSAPGTVNLQNGGALVTNQIVGGYSAGGTMTLNFDGGILAANNANNANWITAGTGGSAASFVLEGGATFDTAGYNMGIGNLSNSVLFQHAGTAFFDGGVKKIGVGTLTLNGNNTYTGNTEVDEGVLTVNGATLLEVLDGGVSSCFLGNGGLNLNGLLNLDLSNVSETAADMWHLVDVANLTANYGGSFSVKAVGGASFTSAGSGLWTYADGAKTWTFSQTTGTLSLAAVPEPGTLVLLACGLTGMAACAWKKRK